MTGNDRLVDPDDPYDDDQEFQQQPVPGPGAALCWNCDHPVSQDGEYGRESQDCPLCLSPQVHLVLNLDTPRLTATADPHRPLRLGRDPEWAPHTAVTLSGSPGVSRRHATLTVAEDGAAWVTEETAGTTNGTWLNGQRVEPPGTRHALSDGDQLSLGHRVRGNIKLYRSS